MPFLSFQSCLNSANDELYEIIRIDTIPAFLGVFKGLRNPDGAEGTGSPPRTHVDDPVIHKYSEGIENADTPEISISNECLSYTCTCHLREPGTDVLRALNSNVPAVGHISLDISQNCTW